MLEGDAGPMCEQHRAHGRAGVTDAGVLGQIVNQLFRPGRGCCNWLGGELIGSPRLAVFELVKNAYDADANEVIVRLDLGSGDSPGVTVTDDGEDMALDVLRSVWLVPGDDHRRRQREGRRRSPRHHRLPFGEKELGRFAVHKLGNRITRTTRALDCDECVVEIDWNELIDKPFLDEAPVTILVRPPEVFTGEMSTSCLHYLPPSRRTAAMRRTTA